MGNYFSCVFSPPAPSGTVKVILQDGHAEEFDRPVKAAELMVNYCQQFVSHAGSVQVGRRPAALAADEDLEPGFVYFMLPMQKLGFKLTEYDVESLLFKANSVSKRRSGSQARIRPLVKKFEDEEMTVSRPREGVSTDLMDIYLGDVMNTGMHRSSISRSWKPALETITEVR